MGPVAPPNPQLLGSLSICRSQPLVCLFPSQSANPALHVPLHTPEPQLGVMMLVAEHTTPQPAPGNPLAPGVPVAPPTPQFIGSLSTRLSHPSLSLLPLQSAKLAAQLPLHRPLPQVLVAMFSVPTA